MHRPIGQGSEDQDGAAYLRSLTAGPKDEVSARDLISLAVVIEPDLIRPKFFSDIAILDH